jgi:hypothetical protein
MLITFAPALLASWTAIEPTPPAAADTAKPTSEVDPAQMNDFARVFGAPVSHLRMARASSCAKSKGGL